MRRGSTSPRAFVASFVCFAEKWVAHSACMCSCFIYKCLFCYFTELKKLIIVNLQFWTVHSSDLAATFCGVFCLPPVLEGGNTQPIQKQIIKRLAPWAKRARTSKQQDRRTNTFAHIPTRESRQQRASLYLSYTRALCGRLCWFDSLDCERPRNEELRSGEWRYEVVKLKVLVMMLLFDVRARMCIWVYGCVLHACVSTCAANRWTVLRIRSGSEVKCAPLSLLRAHYCVTV